MITVKDIQGVLFGVCEWRVHDENGIFEKSFLSHAYEVRFERGFANYEVIKIDSGARTDGYTVVYIWAPRN